MSNALILTPREQLERTLGKGSLADLVKSTRQSMLLVDVSSSMAGTIHGLGVRKIDELRKVVTALRDTHPVPVVAFGLSRRGTDTGVAMVDNIPDPQGSTPLHSGIAFAKNAGATHLVVVSDGEPDSQTHALNEAKAFGGPIDVFFVGNPGDPGSEFLARLAAATGGKSDVTDLSAPKELAGKITALLGDGSESPAPRPTIIL